MYNLPQNWKVKPVTKTVDVDGFKDTETRYVIVDADTGEIIDDAQGYGYKTTQKAYKAVAFKKNKNGAQKNKKVVESFLRKHRDFAEEMEDLCFMAAKENCQITKEDVKDVLKEMSINTNSNMIELLFTFYKQ